jgi:hypothetical protein
MESPISLRIAGRSLTRQLAAVATFSAIYAVFRYIPTFPMYGLPGTSFRAGDFLAPLLGILLGPFLAIPCIIIGTFINYALAPPIFLGLDFLPACSAAIVAGLITSGRTKYAIVYYVAILATFLALPLSTFWITVPGGFQVPYTWLHIVTLIALISPLGLKAFKWSQSAAGIPLVFGVLVTILSATMAQHLTGGILYELILFPNIHITTPAKAASFWSFVFKFYPIERTVITAISTFFAVSLLRAVRSSGLEEALHQIRRPTQPGPLVSKQD